MNVNAETVTIDILFNRIAELENRCTSLEEIDNKINDYIIQIAKYEKESKYLHLEIRRLTKLISWYADERVRLIDQKNLWLKRYKKTIGEEKIGNPFRERE
jgi:hypothetical protein